MLSLQLRAPMPARLSRFNQTTLASAITPRSGVLPRLQSRYVRQKPAPNVHDARAGGQQHRIYTTHNNNSCGDNDEPITA
ncbi:hypothetical protein J2W43_000063 [Pseudomonas brassicacearum]|uniref:Uncharacterized protein n=1 Tax=Pseudomonas brassicacearum TaxID=930166 RepID=A0AAW8M320_9PSED|nr:hypothetical protein [Pseudomonas brassicacearum]